MSFSGGYLSKSEYAVPIYSKYISISPVFKAEKITCVPPRSVFFLTDMSVFSSIIYAAKFVKIDCSVKSFPPIVIDLSFFTPPVSDDAIKAIITTAALIPIIVFVCFLLLVFVFFCIFLGVTNFSIVATIKSTAKASKHAGIAPANI